MKEAGAASVLLLVHRPASRLLMPKIWREALIAVSVSLQVQRLPETSVQTRKFKEYHQETIVWRETSTETK
jgi:hypothetical protein